MSFLTKLFGDPNAKVVKELREVADKINTLETQISALSDEDLKAQTAKLRERLTKGETLDDLLPEAFATVREASKRVLGQRHFDVQLIGGIALHRGHIAEMRTGEGKTLTATAPMYLNALAGKGAHLVTVNDYLSRIHADWMGRVYDFLGMTVGCIQQQNISYKFDAGHTKNEGDPVLDVQNLVPCTRKEAYACDILYGTNNEFGFDYLRDNMVQNLDDMVQRDLYYAIVDEVDSILIDEARTPLIISAPDAESTSKYSQFAQIVVKLRPEEDYKVDEKLRAATLTEEGIAKVEKMLGVENIYTDRGIAEVHHIEQALKAHALFKRDKDYVVKDGEIVIIDEFTGRMMFGRRYSEGLHQAIEAKEGVKVQKESLTLATVSFQNYFRLYEKLSGMTGTAATEAEEFAKIYKLEVTTIPTNRPMVRQDLNDRIYKNESGKLQALVREVKERHEKGQPVLIGTISIEKNEILAEMLEREGVPCQVLNAKHHEKEAHIIAQAGRLGAVTVATNMAGRGVDIILGGHPFDQQEYDKVVEAGGLCVLGTERHESRRIDNQLRGRAGRQGDPGMSQFYISMDDDLMRIFGAERMKKMMTTLGVPDDMPIENGMVSKSVETAQKKVETHNFDIRKHLVEYDDVMNKQRETIYRKRRQLLEGEGTKEAVVEAINNEIDVVVDVYLASNDEEAWDLEQIYKDVGVIFPVKPELKKTLEELRKEAGDRQEDFMAREAIGGHIKKLAVEAYNDLESQINLLDDGNQKLAPMRQVERGICLRVIDSLWIEHLETMQYLRTGIGLRGYGQRDPLVEYKRESLRMFRELLGMIDRQIAYSIYKIGFVSPQEMNQEQGPKNLQLSGASEKSAFEGDEGLQQRKADKILEDKTHFDGEKVGRNDACPCGATWPDGNPKKYKDCHGK
ncbi:MAG: preprotein translocase subunit SecA [Parcubacteria group bacterium ADurb.Bin326]|nr:MAG: preprotein translocase subunit SecA [Parcubacteria group bacterium ADurb.Bin326]